MLLGGLDLIITPAPVSGDHTQPPLGLEALQVSILTSSDVQRLVSAVWAEMTAVENVFYNSVGN